MPISVPYRWCKFQDLRVGDLFVFPRQGLIIHGIYLFDRDRKKVIMSLPRSDEPANMIAGVELMPFSEPVMNYGNQWKFTPHKIINKFIDRIGLQNISGACAFTTHGHVIRLETGGAPIWYCIETLTQVDLFNPEESIFFLSWEIEVQKSALEKDGYVNFANFEAQL